MSTPRRRRPPPRRRWPLLLLALAATALIFLLGVGLGLTLEERPSPGGELTSVRTLRPLPLPMGTSGG
ncbi:MAG: hypothetical protein ICV67_04210 [Thermoleophilia bacterium]|nr:hypothetical protein [Thermoleophilia bacterium]